MKWQNLFRSITLEKGAVYVQKRNVQKVTKLEDGYEALVIGTKTYKVKICIEGGNLSVMTCECQYAAAGSYCKHMAAVLYFLEEQKEEVRRYCACIEDAFRPGMDFEVRISNLLFFNIPEMLLQGNQESAVLVLLHLFKQLKKHQTAACRLYKEQYMVVKEACQSCSYILQEGLNSKQKSELFEWFYRGWMCWDREGSKEEIIRLLMEHFEEPEFLPKKLRIVESCIKDQGTADWMIRKLELMEAMKGDPKKLYRAVTKYWYLPEVRLWYVGRLVLQEEYKKAIHVLEIGKRIDSRDHDLVLQQSRMLITLHRKIFES